MESYELWLYEKSISRPLFARVTSSKTKIRGLIPIQFDSSES